VSGGALYGYIGAALHKVFVCSMYEVGYMMGMDVMTPVTGGTCWIWTI
jgi:hypothetical protein